MITNKTDHMKELWLTCKKAYIDRTPTVNKRHRSVAKRYTGSGYKKTERISPGKKYKVISKTTNNKGKRVWLFEIPQPDDKDNPIGSGSFDIDEFFITPEEEREIKIDEIFS